MSDLKRSVQQQFDRVAANYRTSSVHAKGAELEQMVALAGLQGGERVLDAGCGAGHTAMAFAPHVRQVIALDFTQSMLTQVQQLAAERSMANVETRQGDVEQLPFADGSFDLVVSRYSAHHWPHPQQALAEIQRVLRPGGRVLLADVVGFDDPTCDTFLNAVELLRDPSHVRDFTPNEWLAMFDGAGFAADIPFRWDLYLEFASWLERMATSDLHARAVHSLLRGAPAEVRNALRIQQDGFWFPCAIVRGSRR